MDEKIERAAKNLAQTARRVLNEFRAGYSPSFELLERLERDLAPFEMEKICGHSVIEECICGTAKEAHPNG